MDKALERYMSEHSSPQSEALEWIEKQTCVRTNFRQMLSGAVQGRFLTMLARICDARNILEIGTFTGYSAVCLAYGAPEGHVDTLEINDELEDLIREGWERAGVSDRIALHVGDARETLKGLGGKQYDMVYVDANKREYPDYWDEVVGMVRSGGIIVVDDVMQGGKVALTPPPADAQTSSLLEFNDKVASDSRVEVVMLPIRDGVSLIRKL